MTTKSSMKASELFANSSNSHVTSNRLRGLHPANTGTRATALVIDTVVVSLVNAVCLIPAIVAVQLSSPATIGVATAFAVLGVVALIWFEVIDLWRRGQTLGMRVAGISWLRWSTPGAPGLNAIAKALVLSLVGSLTLGIGAVIIFLVSQDRWGRSWFDRVSDIVVVTDKDVNAVEYLSGQTSDSAAPVERRTGRRLPSRDGAPYSPLWHALRDQGAGDQGRGTDHSRGERDHDRFRNPEDFINIDEHLQSTVTVSVRQPQSTPPGLAGTGGGAAVSESGTSLSGTRDFIAEVPWQSGDPQAAEALAWRSTASASEHAGVVDEQAAADPGSTPLSTASSPLGSDPADPVIVPLSARQAHSAAPEVPAPGAVTTSPRERRVSQEPHAPQDLLDRTVAGPASRAALSLLLDTGQQVELRIGDIVLLGRDPQAVAPWERARTIAVNDPEFSISKTHVAIILDGTGVLVQDLGSTNGTAIETPDGALTAATENQHVRASVGDVVHFGRRRFTVGH